MNMFSTIFFSEQELEENGIIQQYGMNTIMGEFYEARHTLQHSFSNLMTSTNDPSHDDLIEKKPSNILNTTYISPNLQPPPSNSKPHFHHQPSSTILSFEHAYPNVMDHDQHSPTYLNSTSGHKVESEVPPNWMNEPINRKGIKTVPPLDRSQSNAQDHIIAERKRREKLTQRFVALTALLPGLKKTDKASVLEDAQKHIKYLQEKVGEFENQKRERILESMVVVKKSKLILDDNKQSFSSCCEHDSSSLDLPEIEVKFSDKDVLVKILCEKQKGHIAKIVAEVEKLHFSITNSSVLPFGPTLDITIIAKKKSDFDVTLMDVVKSLRTALSKFM